MGEFTQSLLKLTEFPFSYSLIGLLALIFGHGTNLEELSFAKIGPLLILMGFVATTLSICDPIGTLQRRIIKGKGRQMHVGNTLNTMLNITIFGLRLNRVIPPMPILGDYFPLSYLFAIIYSPEDIIKKYNYGWDRVRVPEEVYNAKDYSPGAIVVDDDDCSRVWWHDVIEITKLLEGLKQQTVKTKWITAEVDRITALVYFVIVISVFIIATLLYPVFLQKFAQVFQNNESTKLAILIFSSLALGAVSYMFILRILGLQRKASVAFRYLTALEAIKAAKEDFKTTLQDIERYLDNNDWTLAEYWVKRIQIEYTEFFLEKVKAEK
jgi:hypothetical protein